MSLPAIGSVDRNGSLPSRGAWIEIIPLAAAAPVLIVAPLAGSVDRNKEIGVNLMRGLAVAPLAGSVDRNMLHGRCTVAFNWSLPSRGAWIEMTLPTTPSASPPPVAPLAGSVDRNCQRIGQKRIRRRSLPSRGAWIEIYIYGAAIQI